LRFVTFVTLFLFRYRFCISAFVLFWYISWLSFDLDLCILLNVVRPQFWSDVLFTNALTTSLFYLRCVTFLHLDSHLLLLLFATFGGIHYYSAFALFGDFTGLHSYAFSVDIRVCAHGTFCHYSCICSLFICIHSSTWFSMHTFIIYTIYIHIYYIVFHCPFCCLLINYSLHCCLFAILHILLLFVLCVAFCRRVDLFSVFVCVSCSCAVRTLRTRVIRLPFYLRIISLDSIALRFVVIARHIPWRFARRTPFSPLAFGCGLPHTTTHTHTTHRAAATHTHHHYHTTHTHTTAHTTFHCPYTTTHHTAHLHHTHTPPHTTHRAHTTLPTHTHAPPRTFPHTGRSVVGWIRCLHIAVPRCQILYRCLLLPVPCWCRTPHSSCWILNVLRLPRYIVVTGCSTPTVNIWPLLALCRISPHWLYPSVVDGFWFTWFIRFGYLICLFLPGFCCSTVTLPLPYWQRLYLCIWTHTPCHPTPTCHHTHHPHHTTHPTTHRRVWTSYHPAVL